MQNRKGDSVEKHWYRSSRYFRSGDHWYFTTREQWNIGPFYTREVAEQAAERYLKALKENKPSQVAKMLAMRDCWGTVEFG